MKGLKAERMLASEGVVPAIATTQHTQLNPIHAASISSSSSTISARFILPPARPTHCVQVPPTALEKILKHETCVDIPNSKYSNLGVSYEMEENGFEKRQGILNT